MQQAPATSIVKALTHDPSRRAVLTAVKTGRVSGVPSELKIFPKKHCSAMLFRLTGRQTGRVTGIAVMTAGKRGVVFLQNRFFYLFITVL